MEFPYTSKLCINLCIEEAMGRACNCSFLPYMEISRTTYRYNQATEQLYDYCNALIYNRDKKDCFMSCFIEKMILQSI